LSAALAFVVAFAPTSPVRDASAGDAKVADSLFKSGKQALAKGDAAGAVSFFKKAQEENPDLIEACWWRASAQEKAGDKPGALASYREFVASYDGKYKSGAAVTKEEQRLKGLADKSVEALAVGEKEFKKLEDAYVAQLLAFAKDNFVRDPGVSRRAVAAILAVRPDDPEAQKLDEKLGGPPASAGATANGPGAEVGPFKDVKTWRDLVADHSYKSEFTEFSGDLMTMDCKECKAISPAGFIDTGKAFAFESEFRLLEKHDPKWLVGLGCAWKQGAFVATIVVPGRVVVVRYHANGQHEDLADADVPGIEPNTWHRLGIVVKGPSLEVWLDGKKATSWKEPPSADLAGEIVLFVDRCKSEWRVLHVGKLD
jgi:tetratricopeptide (TPR) repeat protein